MDALYAPSTSALVPVPLPRKRGSSASVSTVAVVLNKNARGVTPRMIRRVSELLDGRDVFVSESREHCRSIAEQIVATGYQTVLFGGGDGTFVGCLNDVVAACARSSARLPRLGVLRLGTGNALGYYLGISPPTVRGLKKELARARDASAHERQLPLLKVDGILTPFAGTGLDSQILEDYSLTTRTLDAMRVGQLLGSPIRYMLAVALCSIPRFIVRRLPQVEVVNVGGPAYAIGLDGQPDKTPLPRGTVLYRGPCTLAGGATIPCYGFNVRIFPFADLRADRFHLRCTDASALETIAHLPSVLSGKFRSRSLRDFLCDAVEIHLERPVPMQIGGDLLKERRDLMRIELAHEKISVLGDAAPMLPQSA